MEKELILFQRKKRFGVLSTKLAGIVEDDPSCWRIVVRQREMTVEARSGTLLQSE
jgi:hypothetical protein